MSRSDTQSLIIAAAVKLFASQGFENTAVDDIAAEARVAKGTVFYNFKTKDEIFLSILKKGIDDLAAAVRERAEAEGNASQKIEAVYDGSVEFLQRFGSLCSVLVSELGRIRSRWNVDPLQLLDPYLKVIAAILAEGQKSGEFRKDIDPGEMGLIVFLAVASSGLGRVMTMGYSELHLFAPTKLIILKGIQNDG